MSKLDKIKLWVPVVIWCGVIFGFSSLQINKGVNFSWLDFVVKKTAHVTEYAILYWLVYRALSEKGKKASKKCFAVALAFAFLYAMSDEWHQTFTPGREGTLRDVGFDTIGALISYTRVRRLR